MHVYINKTSICSSGTTAASKPPRANVASVKIVSVHICAKGRAAGAACRARAGQRVLHVLGTAQTLSPRTTTVVGWRVGGTSAQARRSSAVSVQVRVARSHSQLSSIRDVVVKVRAAHLC